MKNYKTSIFLICSVNLTKLAMQFEEMIWTALSARSEGHITLDDVRSGRAAWRSVRLGLRIKQRVGGGISENSDEFDGDHQN